MRWTSWLGFGLSATLTIGCSGPDWQAGEEIDETQQAILGGYVDNDTSGVLGLGVEPRAHLFLGHCSGTLIAPNLVLTARHCVMAVSLEEEGVICGMSEFGKTLPAPMVVVSPKTIRPTAATDPSLVAGASIHPVPGGDDICGQDVALIILERPLTEREATPITPRIDRRVAFGEVFSSAGYGLTGVQDDAQAGTRMRVDDNVVLCAQAECTQFVPGAVSATEWLSADAGVCSGDSGGPALDEEGRVIGVVSRGGGVCDATIYGDVAAWSSFIIETALQAAEVGGYEAPFWTSGSSEPLPDAALVEPEDLAQQDSQPQGSDGCVGGDCPADDSCAADDSCGSPRALEPEGSCSVPGIGSSRGGRPGPLLSGLVLGLVGLSGLRRRRA